MISAIFILKGHIAEGSGIGTYIKELVSELSHSFYYHIYIINLHNFSQREVEVKNISSQVTELFIPGIKGTDGCSLKYARSICLILSEYIKLYSHVVFHSNFFEELKLLKELKRKFNFPVLAVVHFSYLNINEIDYKIKEYYEYVDKIIFLNEYTQIQSVQIYGIPIIKTELIHNGINCNSFVKLNPKEKNKIKKELGFNSRNKIILFVGRLEKEKGVLDLIEAFARVSQKDSSFRLVLIGHGNYAEILSWNGILYGNVTFTGFISKEKLEQFYQIADMGILPSYNEQQPYVLMEMARAKIPLILSGIDSLSTMFNKEEAVFLNLKEDLTGTFFLDIDLFVTELRNIAQDKSRRRKLAQKAFSRIENDYNITYAVNNMYRVYSEMLNMIDESPEGMHIDVNIK